MVNHKTPRATNLTSLNTMKANKGKDTKLELIVRHSLWKQGYRYRKNNRQLLGAPDISFPSLKIVIFLDSCFWHACPIHFIMPKSNIEYWIPKIHRNIERDNEVSNHYLEDKWTLLRFWEHEVYDDLDRVINTIKFFVEEKKKAKAK